MRKYKILYNKLLESGDLSEMFPDFTGDWEEDKKSFIREQEELEQLLTDTEIEDIDAEDEY